MGSASSRGSLDINTFIKKKECPSTKKTQGDVTTHTHPVLPGNGTQPEGQMTFVTLNTDLPGYPNNNTIQICYTFADGIQTERHPNPGQPYSGCRMMAYLPDNREGQKVLKLLEKAFKERLLFTVATIGNSEVVTWASIPHKTSMSKGDISVSYPDPEYLKSVKEKLKVKGIK